MTFSLENFFLALNSSKQSSFPSFLKFSVNDKFTALQQIYTAICAKIQTKDTPVNKVSDFDVNCTYKK